MSTPLLETKLYVPRSRGGLVSRPRLSRRLDQATTSKLMLVSAPAGFGKSTLLAEWLAPTAGAGAAAWLSLDAGDNDAATFWAYLIAALQTVEPGVGADALAVLGEPQPPPIQVVLTTLLNDLAGLTRDVVLVLDDYHAVESRDVQEAMAFLLEHLPPRVHLVIASRADPALPLARLRARGELVEVRAAELRFTPEEVAAYFEEWTGLHLGAADVTALAGRTEGWIAALQLAALSMQGRDDVGDFIAGFAGDDRYVVDYLVEEVVQRQSEEVQTFLLQTSVLERLTGPLCDAVTERDGGKAMLDALDRANLFMVPLDDRRQWYRYHHLFADVLQARLMDEQPARVPALHRRASDWFEQHGERAVAVRHALAGADFERAAELVELALPVMRRDRQESTIRAWIELLPEELLDARPVLSNMLAGALLSTGEIEGVERRLETAERWLAASVEGGGPGSRMVVVDHDEFRRLPGGVAVHRAGLALVHGDPSATVRHARRALGLLEEHDHLGRSAATALIGLASWFGGDLESARQAYVTCLGSMQRAGHLADVLGLSIALADLQITQGRLRDATRTYEQGLRLAPDHGVPVLRGTADMHVGLSALHRERNDLAAATECLRRSEELGDLLALPQNRYRWRVAMARIREAEGDLEAAIVLYDEAERVYTGDFSPDVRPVPAMRARAWVAQGRVEDALAWLDERGVSVADDLGYLREFEHITLARALLRRGGTDSGHPSLDEVSQFLERLLRAAEEGARTGSVIEILVLQAVAHRTAGDLRAALVPLGRALALAEPEGYVRVFLDEGPAIATVLRAAAKQGIARSYVGRLLADLSGTEEARTPSPAPGHPLVDPLVAPLMDPLIDPLSERELDVLRLLGSELDGPEIARELSVSLNTMRSHTKSIYTKLGVNSRRSAVRRARELDLLGRGPAR